MVQTTGRAAYLACRDMLVRHRDDYDAAIAAFRWPERRPVRPWHRPPGQPLWLCPRLTSV